MRYLKFILEAIEKTFILFFSYGSLAVGGFIVDALALPYPKFCKFCVCMFIYSILDHIYAPYFYSTQSRKPESDSTDSREF